jgi:hypothetical protein
MIRKFIVTMSLGPSLSFLAACVRTCCGTHTRPLDPVKVVPVLLSQFEVAVVLGAFVPALLPVALLSFLINLWSMKEVAHTASTQSLLEKHQDLYYPMVVRYMFACPVLLSLFACVFFWENSPHEGSILSNPWFDSRLPALDGLPIMLALLALVVVVPIGYAGWAWKCDKQESPQTIIDLHLAGASLAADGITSLVS